MSIDRATKMLTSLVGWGRYGVVVAIVGAGVVAAADLAMTSMVRALDDAVARAPSDSVDEDPSPRAGMVVPIAQPTASRDSGAPPRATATGFEHARPAPRLFERVDSAEAERIKSSVSDRVVAEGPEAWYTGNGQTFRTMCVRLCDGAYFPISFSTTRGRFARDEAVCASRCAAPARLFVVPNPGGSPETMMDRSGHSYVSLPTAFQFRRGRTAGCACRPEAWEEAARARHHQYAAAAAAETRPQAFATAEGAGGAAVDNGAPHSAQPGSAPTVTGSLQSTGRGAGEQTAALRDRDRIEDFVAQQVREVSLVPETLAVEPAVVENARIVSAVELAPAVPGKPAKTRKSRQARRKLPAGTGETAAELPGELVAMTSPVKALQKAFSIGFVSAPIWGPGPNSVNAPSGNTARDIFARNFY